MVSVTPLQKVDEEKAKALEKIANYSWDKLMDIPEFRKDFARLCITGEIISKEEL